MFCSFCSHLRSQNLLSFHKESQQVRRFWESVETYKEHRTNNSLSMKEHLVASKNMKLGPQRKLTYSK